MDFDELSHALDQTYSECYVSGREEGLEEFGRRHSADIESAIKSGRTLEELVEQARIGPASYWGGTGGAGDGFRGPAKCPRTSRQVVGGKERKTVTADRYSRLGEVEPRFANLATKDGLGPNPSPEP